MLLRNPFFQDNLGQDQPYNSILLVAPYCSFPCEGCQNKHLQDAELKEFSVGKIAERYLTNPFAEGITVGGLEPFESGEEFFKDLLDLCIRIKPRLTIYTRFSYDEVKPIVDEFIPHVTELYLKTGPYEENAGTRTFEFNDQVVTIGSNQDFLQLKKFVLDKSIANPNSGV